VFFLKKWYALLIQPIEIYANSGTIDSRQKIRVPINQMAKLLTESNSSIFGAK
jgi:hypothetical protein